MKSRSAIQIILAIIGIIGTIAGVVVLPYGPMRDALLFLCALLVFALVVLVAQGMLGSFDAISTFQALRMLGIAKVHFSGRETIVSQHIATSRNVKILAVSANALVRLHQDEIVHSLRENSTVFQVLLAEPNSNFISDIEEMESWQRRGQIGPEIVNTLNLLSEYVELASKGTTITTSSGRVEIGSFTTQLRDSIVICDDMWGWMTINLPPKRALQTMSLEVIPAKNGLLTDCIEHFNKAWELAHAHNRIRVLK